MTFSHYLALDALCLEPSGGFVGGEIDAMTEGRSVTPLIFNHYLASKALYPEPGGSFNGGEAEGAASRKGGPSPSWPFSR